MKLIFENWRKFLKEHFVDDIISTLEKDIEDKEAQPERAAQAAKWKESPPSTEADWEKFKQWKSDVEKKDHDVISPEEYEKAEQQRAENKPKETLEYNCNKMYKFILDYEWRRIGRFDCSSLARATQGLSPGQGSPSQVFTQSKFVKAIGEGAFGVAMLFDNGHIVKVFKGGIHGGSQANELKAELETYANLLNSQFGSTAKSYDMAVYEYGTIPVYVPNAERDMLNPVEYFGYAEIGKVIPFQSWISDNFKESAHQAQFVGDFFNNDIYDGLATAGNRSKTKRTYGEKLEGHHIKLFDQIKGGAEEYADYVIKWIKNRGLENNSNYVQKYGWAGEYSEFRDINNDIDPADIPAIPEALNSGRGAKFLKDFLIALYDVAKSGGDEYLYGRATRDVHTGNFGISYQTGEVIIFDR